MVVQTFKRSANWKCWRMKEVWDWVQRTSGMTEMAGKLPETLRYDITNSFFLTTLFLYVVKELMRK